MAVQFNWYGGEYMVKQREVLARKLESAAIALKGEIKMSLRIGNKTGKHPSAPGEPPRSVHGGQGLMGRIAHEVSGGGIIGRAVGAVMSIGSSIVGHEVDKRDLVARVGTNLYFAKFLELGTSKMAARPFIRPALEKMKYEIGRILAGDPI